MLNDPKTRLPYKDNNDEWEDKSTGNPDEMIEEKEDDNELETEL